MDLTQDDLLAIGRHVVALAGTSAMLGHDNPAASTIYAGSDGTPMSDFVWDIFRSCIPGDPTESHAARDRYYQFVFDYGIDAVIAEAVTR